MSYTKYVSSVRVRRDPEGGNGWQVSFSDSDGYHSKMYPDYQSARDAAYELAAERPPLVLQVSTPTPGSAVDKCRQNGWGPGTHLRKGGIEIELTALGENRVLAKYTTHNNPAGELSIASLEGFEEVEGFGIA